MQWTPMQAAAIVAILTVARSGLVALARGEPERTPRAVSQPLAAELRT